MNLKENYQRLFGKDSLNEFSMPWLVHDDETEMKLDFVVDTSKGWGSYGGIAPGVRLIPTKKPNQVVKTKTGHMRVSSKSEEYLEKTFKKLTGFDWYVSNNEFIEGNKHGLDWWHLLSINPNSNDDVKSGKFDASEKQLKGKKFKLVVAVKPRDK
tara:strand:+ start:430 stop:894 length:465 start_codon:yes stop_codon:yes gene_type:complete